MFTVSYFMTRLGTLFAILPLLTPRKVANLLAAIARFLVRADRSVDHPPVLILSLTSRCNFSCIMCKKSSTKEHASLFNYDRPRDLDMDRLEELLREHRDYLCMVYLHGGEPLYHAQVDRLIRRLNEWRIPYQIGTNGSLLTEELTRVLMEGTCVGVSVSIDGATAPVYERMRRGGNFGLLTENLVRINQLKRERHSRRPVLTASMCVFAQNVDEMVGVVQYCHDHGIRKLSIIEGWDYTTPDIGEEDLVRNNRDRTQAAVHAVRQLARELGVRVITSFPSLDDEKQHSPIVAPGSRPPRNCLNLYVSTWLMPDQGVIGCSNATVALGNLQSSTFAEIWNRDARGYVGARRDLREGRVPEGCSKCIYAGSFFS